MVRAASALTVKIKGLPTNGTVVLSDGTTTVTSGQTLTVAQLTGLMFKASASVKGFGCRPLTEGARHSGGRRTKPSKGRNRGKWDAIVQRALWGFERRR
jgi:hypothetical protein